MRGFQRSIFGSPTLGDAAMRFDCPRIAFGDETTTPRAGLFLLKGPKP